MTKESATFETPQYLIITLLQPSIIPFLQKYLAGIILNQKL